MKHVRFLNTLVTGFVISWCTLEVLTAESFLPLVHHHNFDWYEGWRVCWYTLVLKYLHLLQVGRQDSWLAVWKQVVGASRGRSHWGRLRRSGQRHHDGGWQAAGTAALTLGHRSAETNKERHTHIKKKWDHCCSRKSFKLLPYHINKKQKKRKRRLEKEGTWTKEYYWRDHWIVWEKRKTGKRERKSVPNMNRPSILCPAPH